jgi:hypothetical protein
MKAFLAALCLAAITGQAFAGVIDTPSSKTALSNFESARVGIIKAGYRRHRQARLYFRRFGREEGVTFSVYPHVYVWHLIPCQDLYCRDRIPYYPELGRDQTQRVTTHMF